MYWENKPWHSRTRLRRNTTAGIGNWNFGADSIGVRQ
nr:MAG TPA: hypothetical protein [Caudoviricetes sp.]